MNFLVTSLISIFLLSSITTRIITKYVEKNTFAPKNNATNEIQSVLFHFSLVAKYIETVSIAISARPMIPSPTKINKTLLFKLLLNSVPNPEPNSILLKGNVERTSYPPNLPLKEPLPSKSEKLIREKVSDTNLVLKMITRAMATRLPTPANQSSECFFSNLLISQNRSIKAIRK